jgi:phage FluMu protein Com
MTELNVTLEFACCDCEETITVTVRCTGEGLARKAGAATVNVPCPTCGQVNQLYFEPNGTVRSVQLYCRRPVPTFSLN